MDKKSVRATYELFRKKHALDTSISTSRVETSSGIPIDPISIPQDEALSGAGVERYLESVGFPGEFPFTRGVHPTMYRGRLWTMRQYSGFGSAKETNERYRYLLSQGVSGLSVAFDLPTQMGRDPDDARSKGEVGRVGVSISTSADMDLLLSGIPLEKVSISMTINATAHILLALYLVVARRRGVDWSKLRGTIQNDVLKEYIARGTYLYPPKASLRIATDIFEFCKEEVPEWNTISISGYHIREAGSTATQELAFTFADAIAYLDAARARGLSIEEIAPRIAFFFNCHSDFLEEVAKFRAARRIYARLIRDRYGVQNPRAQMLRFHTQTAGSSLTAQQPQVNTVRTTLQAFAAVLGGTQSLHTNAYDEALALPTEASAQLALRTQQVIAHESGVADYVDPLAGSYVVEALTDAIEAKVQIYLDRIDEMGGMVRAIELHYPQREIEEAAYRFQNEIERGERIVVGVNKFVEAGDGAALPVLKIDPAIEGRQILSLREFLNTRDAARVLTQLRELEKAARDGGNIMPSVVDAVDVGATLGEISSKLRDVFGDYAG